VVSLEIISEELVRACDLPECGVCRMKHSSGIEVCSRCWFDDKSPDHHPGMDERLRQSETLLRERDAEIERLKPKLATTLVEAHFSQINAADDLVNANKRWKDAVDRADVFLNELATVKRELAEAREKLASAEKRIQDAHDHPYKATDGNYAMMVTRMRQILRPPQPGETENRERHTRECWFFLTRPVPPDHPKPKCTCSPEWLNKQMQEPS